MPSAPHLAGKVASRPYSGCVLVDVDVLKIYQSPLHHKCHCAFSGLIESEKLKYLERSSPLEKCPLRPCICVFLSPGVHSILMSMIPKFRSTLWTPRGPRPYVCLPFRHLLLDVHRKSPCPDLFSASSCLQSRCVF